MFYRIKSSLTAVVAFASVCLFAIQVSSADEFAGKQWAGADQIAIDQIDHSPFDGLLKKHVDTNGMVNYRAWHADATDRATLKSYLESLSRADPNRPSSREGQIAFWSNAYNALTIEGILRVYPTTSIRNHTAKIAGYNIWKNLYLQVGNQRYSLEGIEHNVLRPMGEPRVHFAIVCASIGCPRLLNEAYVKERLEDQLIINSTDFFSRPQNLKVSQGTLHLSKIIEWYGKDFGNSTQAQIQAMNPYFPTEAQALVARGGFRIQYLSYDWNLNTQR